MLARFTTKIIADKTKYPFLFPTVTALRKANWKTDVTGYMAGPVPETVLPVCAGGRRLRVLRDTFTTRSGREVALELYVIAATLIVRRGR